MIKEFAKSVARSPFVVRFQNAVYQNQKTAKMIFISYLIGLMPLVYYINCIHEQGETREALAVASALLVGVTMAIGLRVVYSIFGYLHNSEMVDFEYSLPISQRRRFVYDYISGLVIYVLPFLASIPVILILSYLGEMIKAPDGIALCLRTVVINSLTAVSFYTIAVFFTLLGRLKADASMFIGLAALLIPVVRNVARIWFLGGKRGFEVFSYMFSLYVTEDTFCVTPISYCFSVSFFLSDIFKEPEFLSAVILKMVIFTVLVFVGALYIAGKRKGEDCGNPSLRRSFYYIAIAFATIVSMTIATVKGKTEVNAKGFLVSLLIFSIMEVFMQIKKKSVQGLLKRGTFMAFLLIASGLFLAQGGREMKNPRLPDHNDIIRTDAILFTQPDDFVIPSEEVRETLRGDERRQITEDTHFGMDEFVDAYQNADEFRKSGPWDDYNEPWKDAIILIYYTTAGRVRYYCGVVDLYW